MSGRITSTRRVVRRIRYSDGDNTVDVTTVVTPNRPTRPPPGRPGMPPPPAVVPDGMPLLPIAVSERFMATINRAATMVHEDHPLSAAAGTLVSLARGPMRALIPRRVAVRPRPKIIYDTVTVDSSKKIDDTDKCPICLSDYEEGDKCGILPCKHDFHDQCLRIWLDTKRTCPLCRLVLN